MLARAAYEAGTRIMVATPHVLNSFDHNRNLLIQNNFRQFKRLLALELPELTLLLGTEIYFQPNLSFLTQYEAATINGNGRYMLIEFSLVDVPGGFEKELKALHKNGVTPIVAHPERNAAALRKPSLIKQMIDAGALVQLNAGSITGLFGRTVRKMAHNLLKRGWVHTIASDAHSTNHRGPDLRAAVSAASDMIGVANAGRLVLDNPRIIVEGWPWPGKETSEFLLGEHDERRT